MLYRIVIDQAIFCKERYKELDLLDVVIYEDMRTIIEQEGIERTDDGYYVISHKEIIDDLPLYKAKTKGAIKRRINKLRKVGLVELSDDSKELGKSCYKINDIENL